MDRRLHPATPRVAHISLTGQVDAPRFTTGQSLSVAMPLVDLLRSPNGPRIRQLVLGESFCAIDREQGHVFGFAEKDGYCGWLANAALGPILHPTHWVATPGTHLYEGPKVQTAALAPLHMGARLQVIALHGTWAETPAGFVPMAHLKPLDETLADPVSVAESLLGTPYLWGGNSRHGMDCSGLAQIAHLSCGIAAPGDSDLQETMGQALPEDVALQRGDLIFWRGHIALIVDANRLIHANGHTMSVAYEDTAACIARIRAQDGGPVTHRRRL